MSKSTVMKQRLIPLFLLLSGLAGFAQTPAKTFTLTIQVENVNKDDGNIGVLVFNSPHGWPENRFVALKDIVVPAHPGTVMVTVPGLPAGEYAVAIAHDVNKNHKVDKNFFGVPKEQWGMSNNPHALIKAPSFNTAKFALAADMAIHVRMQ
ncbi:MAG: DUF2141 domain-containing protein [Actinomycetota bacterium]